MTSNDTVKPILKLRLSCLASFLWHLKHWKTSGKTKTSNSVKARLFDSASYSLFYGTKIFFKILFPIYDDITRLQFGKGLKVSTFFNYWNSALYHQCRIIFTNSKKVTWHYDEPDLPNFLISDLEYVKLFELIICRSKTSVAKLFRDTNRYLFC